MRILVVNDDGVGDGLLALARVAERLGHSVFLATTHDQRSGYSKSVSFKATYTPAKIGGYEGIVTNSSPASAVLLAFKVFGKEFDFVLSGVNMGPNLGLWDILSSGTVGAVLEAALHGVPGAAVSLVAGSHEEYSSLTYEDYERAARLAVDLLERLEWRPPCEVLNINVPLRTNGSVKFTLPERVPPRDLYRCSGNECRMGYWTLQESYVCSNPRSDVCAIKEGFVSVTPLSPGSLAREDLVKKLTRSTSLG
ncbi:5'/3'-nucleotidase SurE [Thermofilum pendens]|uniref:Exopolyphosphatase / 3'-nucleotidase / 5'-nucleotidase n=1 Tax=Thermofilum pendens (strain DSM 2475 / Hrk 5) TaxID=368408 RepID=A1RWH2_THEPD|nr:5'/3'-nucleotidase SurE [Thermofilum pendens]ABL77552.1 exopolyphosphatase / 3'-nucleotidase / 5'-nucleotidase [Thermofilum pendens Hrk 5]